MTVWETGIAVGIMLVFLAGYLATQADVLGAGDARLRAIVIEQLHAGVKDYLRSEYASLEECLDGPTLEEGWNGETVGGQAGPFKAVRLYPVGTSNPPEEAADHVQALADAAADLDCVDSTLGAPRSLSAAGFLPAVLSGLRYESGADESSNLWRGLDFRLIVRAVNMNREAPNPGAIPPVAAHVGLQAVLVVQGRPGEAMSEREAGAILRAMTVGEGGLLRSVRVGNALAEQTIAGRGGGWRMDVCDSGSTVPGLVSCAAVSGPESQRIPVEADSSGSPVRRAFISGAAAGQRVSGSAGRGRATARVVTVASIGRDEALRDVMFRVDLGVREANRMETDIDTGAYGVLNVSYVTGIDIDGDGLVDRGVSLVGPSRDHAEESRRHPVTVYGDLYVRGALHVGEGLDADGDGTADEFDTNIPPGSIWAQGGVQAGAEAAAGNLPAGALFAHKGVQVGGGTFEVPLDDPDAPDSSIPTAPDGSLWARGAAQIGAVQEFLRYDPADEPVYTAPRHDPAIPPGGLLTGGEIRSSARVRAVGPEIVLAASNSTDPTRAGPNRGWEALAGGLGDIADPDLLDTASDPDAAHTYVGEGGRVQFRTEGDELRMVTDAGTLKVMPASVEPAVPPDPLPPWAGVEGVALEAADDGRIVLDDVDVWVNEQDRWSRSLHAALPRYVSQDFSRESKSHKGWKQKDSADGVPVECPGGGKLRKVLVTMAWSRKYFPREPRMIFTSNFKWIPIFNWQPRPFYPIDPYTGWSVNSVTGIDNGIGPDQASDEYHNPERRSIAGVDRQETTSFTRNYYCDYSDAAVLEPSGDLEHHPDELRDKLRRVYPKDPGH